MNPLYVWGALADVILILAISCVALSYLVFNYRHKHKAHLQQRRQNMLEDLELATSDQLLGELRKRPGVPYLLLSPIEEADHKGMNIEIHNISPIPCLQMLYIATALTFRELKARGVDLPDNPFPPPEGEEWKNQ